MNINNSALSVSTVEDFDPIIWKPPEGPQGGVHIFSDGFCWICRQEKTLTREHIWKRSILKTIYRKYRKIFPNEKIFMNKLGVKKNFIVQSDDSDLVKSIKCICALCNNKRTQQADKAFDAIFTRVIKKEFFLNPKKGPTFIKSDKEQKGLELYGVKLIGCLMAGEGIPIPNRLSSAIMEDDPKKAGILWSIGGIEAARYLSNLKKSNPLSNLTNLSMQMFFLKKFQEDKIGGLQLNILLDEAIFYLYIEFGEDEIDIINDRIPENTKSDIEKIGIKNFPHIPTFIKDFSRKEGFYNFIEIDVDSHNHVGHLLHRREDI